MRDAAGARGRSSSSVPGDPSSAAFFVVAAPITPGSELVIEDVLLNPARIGFVDVLRRMGADIVVDERDERLGEPVGNIAVRAGALHGTTIEGHEAIIDEVPALAVAAAFADGVTEIRDAAELRVKESDRIASVHELLGGLGVGVEPRADGLVVRGGTPAPGHDPVPRRPPDRAGWPPIAANAADGRVDGRGWSAVQVSYPGFLHDLDAIVGDA